MQDFVVSGTAAEKLFGMAEALWEPDLNADELFETVSQSLLNVSIIPHRLVFANVFGQAVDRDAFSGWGAHVWIIEEGQVTKRVLKGRMD